MNLLRVRVVVIGRTLTSAWIETLDFLNPFGKMDVALSRVRGLKLHAEREPCYFIRSHSHECVD